MTSDKSKVCYVREPPHSRNKMVKNSRSKNALIKINAPLSVVKFTFNQVKLSTFWQIQEKMYIGSCMIFEIYFVNNLIPIFLVLS